MEEIMIGKKESGKRTSRQAPDEITDREFMHPAFANGKVLPGKKVDVCPRWAGTAGMRLAAETRRN